jgi:hypothetical protein
MDNKFINLKKEYRDFLRRTVERINRLNINENLTKQKCMDIYKLYQNIYNEIETLPNLNVNDINHIIINYTGNDNDVRTLKKFIKIKNLYIIKKIVKSNLWEQYISKLKREIDLNDSNLNSKKTDYLVSKGVYKLLNQYVDHFRGCWEIADFKDNKVRKIEIVEPDHFNFLKKYLKSKLI